MWSDVLRATKISLSERASCAKILGKTIIGLKTKMSLMWLKKRRKSVARESWVGGSGRKRGWNQTSLH